MGRGQRTVAMGTSANLRKSTVADTCARLQRINLQGDEARQLRKTTLAQLADQTIDSYRSDWNKKLLPFVNQLGLKGGDVETALGPPPERWPGGYRGCALNLAEENLNWAVDRDADKLDNHQRQESRLTNSWVAENISTGWRDTYLSALLDKINNQRHLRPSESEVEWKALCSCWRYWNKDRKKGGQIDAKAALLQVID